jgi:hypothetical protein
LTLLFCFLFSATFGGKQNTMKRTSLLLSLLVSLAANRAFAQQEIYLNVSNAILYEINLGYEKALNDNLALGGFGGYVYGFPDQYLATKFWYIGPEVRYYVSPKYGADRFFFGFYSRIKSGFAETEFYESGYSIQNGQYLSISNTQNQDYFKLAVGFTLGAKWVTRKNLTYGVFAGFGRNLVASYDETSFSTNEDLFQPETYYTSYYRSDLDSEFWDVRVGFNLGWRF